MEGLSIQDRIRGSFLGAMAGDAYGSRFQTMEMPTRNEVWRFGDDTHFLFATAQGVLQSKNVDIEAFGRLYLEAWMRGRLEGLGACSLQAIVRLETGLHPKFTGSYGEYCDGDGAAVRVAPLAFLLDPLQKDSLDSLMESIEITHKNPEAVAGAMAVTMAIRFVQNENQNFLQGVIRHLPVSGVRDRLVELGNHQNMSIREMAHRFGSGGWVIESVPLALMAAQKATVVGLGQVLKELAASSRCPDTQGAIAGLVAGAYFGPACIPEEWKPKLEGSPQFHYFLAKIVEFSSFVAGKQGIQTLF